MDLSIEQIAELVHYLSDPEKEELDKLLTDGMPIWVPQPGPQIMAYESEADFTFYGGAAGGGKTDLAIGLSLTAHIRSIIFRKQGTQLAGIHDRMVDILGSSDNFNSQKNVWRKIDGFRQVEYGSVPNPGDEMKYQGRPHDLIVFDEVTHFSEAVVRFLSGWNRTEQEGQKCRVLCTGNPPTNAEGMWVVDFWGPWLDPDHPDPAEPGELRWYATINGNDIPRPNGKPFTIINNKGEDEVITPKSRTFIPAKIEDNIYYMRTGYKSTLQNLPEPLRSQMLEGNFMYKIDDDPWQVIPTEWVNAAMRRWEDRNSMGFMEGMGADIACGGKDKTVISTRHEGYWFAPLIEYPGADTPNGGVTASLVISNRKNRAPVIVDVVGWGQSTYDHLVENEVQTVAFNGTAKSAYTEKSGQYKMANMRAEAYWKMREALDPANDTGIMLPKHARLKSDLCAPTWTLTPQGILIESKKDLKKRLGRSTDYGDAVVMANMDVAREEDYPWPEESAKSEYEYNPVKQYSRKNPRDEGRVPNIRASHRDMRKKSSSHEYHMNAEERMRDRQRR